MHRRRPGPRDDRGEPGRLSTALATAGGALLIATALRDVFDVLFHPEGRARLSGSVLKLVWAAFGRSQRTRTIAGPLAVIAVVGTWAVLLVLGWALIFWPHLDDGFRAIGETEDSFVDAVYVSLVMLTTLGLGDITPKDDWIQLLAPVEAMIGLGLLTASVSWLLTLYPALNRRRSLAYELWLLKKTEDDSGRAVSDDPHIAEPLYADLISRLVAIERDLVAFPVTSYFRESDERFSLTAGLPYLRELAERGAREDKATEVQLRAAMLGEAIEDYVSTRGRQ